MPAGRIAAPDEGHVSDAADIPSVASRVQRTPPNHGRSTIALATAIMRPDRMDEKILPFADASSPGWSDMLIDALHLAIADKLEHNPRLLGIAVHNLSLWRRRHPERRQMIRRWKIIVYTWEFADILRFLRDSSPDARTLRRESPFCGILTPEEIAAAVLAASTLRRTA